MGVQQTGHHIARGILNHLKKLKSLGAYGLGEPTGPFENIAEMSCLMHDIGNPLLGHSSETTINGWFCQRLYSEDVESQPLIDGRRSVVALRLQDGEEPLNALQRKICQDLCHFEGNAQDIRLVHAPVQMNLIWV